MGEIVSIIQQAGESVAEMRARLVGQTRDSGAPKFGDSAEKVMHQVALLARRPVYRRGKLLAPAPQRVVVGPSLFREFRCTAGCTACCIRFTLDYLPSELPAEMLDAFEERYFEIDGRNFVLRTNDQRELRLCSYLTAVRPDGGLGCALYRTPPLSCISAPQIQIAEHRDGSTYIGKRPFGRAWAFAQTPQCEFDDRPTFAQLADDIALLERFSAWSNYFEIETFLPEIINVLQGFLDGTLRWNRQAIVFE